MEKSHFSSTFALAFGKPVALTNDLVVVEATAASALPTHSLTKFLSPFGRTIISWEPRKVQVFAISTWQNELLPIIDQQKVCFMIIFAA